MTEKKGARKVKKKPSSMNIRLRKLLLSVEKIQNDAIWRLKNIGMTDEQRAKQRGRLEVSRLVVNELYKVEGEVWNHITHAESAAEKIEERTKKK